jgi:CBS domain-containing protein
MPPITDFMTREPITVSPRDSVQRAAQLMDELNVGALPVAHRSRLVGIVTDRDITVRATAAGLDPAATEIDLVMTDRVRCCSSRHSAAEVLGRMAAVQIRRLPVLDDAERLVGIVSLGDIASRHPEGVADALRRISTPSEPDRAALAAAATAA